jgi:broad-specificity NMP kinase
MIAELVGAAGTGKSTLSQRLARRPGVMRASVWKLPRGWWLLNAVRSLPTLLVLCLRTRALPWADMRYMIRLRTLRHMLTRRPARQAPLVVLDEGPVFALAWLRLFGHGRSTGHAMTRWRRAVIRDWAETVDVVVLLDAPDAVLAGRIRTRDQPHRVKAGSDVEIGRFATAYREAFGEVIAALTAANGVRVVRLGSDAEPVDRTVDRLGQLLHRDGDVH